VNRPLVIGARGSELSQIQALQVGEALRAQDPRLQVRYAFSAAVADVAYGFEPPRAERIDWNLGAINRRGGFALHLHEQLDAGAIDIAVHSWKDLPLPDRAGSAVVATLPRADPRDVLLMRHASVAALRAGEFAQRPVRVLSCSARRRVNLAPFLLWALPGSVSSVDFVPVRGDIERRLRTLFGGEADALVIAKAALDRLLDAPSPRFDAVRERIRGLLAQCRLMVTPLGINPAAPGQGALAIEVRRDRADLRSRLAQINDPQSFELVRRERVRLAELGDDETPVGISAVALPFGRVEYERGEHAGRDLWRETLHRNEAPLPRAARGQLWRGDRPEADPFVRERLPVTLPAPPVDTALLVARADALPAHWHPDDGQLVWTAGLSTWRRLAARGVWVAGCDESLGETAAQGARLLFPQITRWLKLTHLEGHRPPRGDALGTYALRAVRDPLPVAGCSHFFWHSGSQLRVYLQRWPGLRDAWHGCGPGNTWQQARELLPAARLRRFLSAEQFATEVAA
jgi:hydroxymethylbilane synthase